MTPQRSEHTFTDSSGIHVHYTSWRVPEPRGVVQVAHGLGEHSGRYEELALALAEAGYTVYADDHHGHGRTGLEQHGGDHAKLGRLGPGGMHAAAQSLADLAELLRREHPDLPLALIGHSWGSLLAQITLNRHPELWDAVVLSGSAHRSITGMNGGDLNKQHHHLGKTGYEWLSRDPKVAERFAADPLCFGTRAAKVWGAVNTVRVLGRPSKRLGRDIPLYLMVGDDDSFGGVLSVERLARDYTVRSGLTDVSLQIYPGARHEIFNETNRREVFADLVAWLDQRLAPAPR
ncbi:alpha/beta hydrolase [Herbiconiux sp. SYSU D00978]|uniref:alpha/beta hydrolase n=1 Tax=Herbiconiux sp. SYSU D00978 TaxID=2812562 RepID=UPI001A95F029|nr:alpha/beta hydrolase [Herbiconiux sp. SYSU D00978]